MFERVEAHGGSLPPHGGRHVVALDRQPRAGRELDGLPVGGHHRDAVFGLVAHHARRVRLQQVPELHRHGVEHGSRRRPVSDQCRDAPQRGLLGGEQAQLVAAQLQLAFRGAQLLLRAPAIGHVTRRRVDHALLGPRAPLEPARRAVAAHVAVLEAPDILPAGKPREGVTRGVPVVRMDEVEEWTRQQLVAAVAERPLERRVHAREVAGGVRDAQEVEGEVEDALGLALGSAPARHRAGDQGHDQREGPRPAQRQPGQELIQRRESPARHADGPATAERPEARDGRGRAVECALQRRPSRATANPRGSPSSDSVSQPCGMKTTRNPGLPAPRPKRARSSAKNPARSPSATFGVAVTAKTDATSLIAFASSGSSETSAPRGMTAVPARGSKRHRKVRRRGRGGADVSAGRHARDRRAEAALVGRPGGWPAPAPPRRRRSARARWPSRPGAARTGAGCARARRASTLPKPATYARAPLNMP